MIGGTLRPSTFGRIHGNDNDDAPPREAAEPWKAPGLALTGSHDPLGGAKVLQKFQGRLDGGDEQTIPRTRARYVEQLSLGIIYVIQVNLIGYGLDSRLERQNLMIAGHDGTALNSSPLARCMMPIETRPAGVSPRSESSRTS